MKFEDNEFDGLLNEAMREAREAEPRMGLEGRVLAGVRSAGHGSSLGWWKWAAVGFALATICAVMFVGRGSRSPEKAVVRVEPKVEVPQPRKPEVVAPKDRGAVASVEKPTRPRRDVRVQREEKVETARVVSAPPPMTAEERALMAMAQHAPEMFPAAEEKQGSTELKPIPKIKIEPLEGAGGEQ